MGLLGEGTRAMADQLKSAMEWALLYETALEALASGNVQSYAVGGQQYTRNDLQTVHDLYMMWRDRVLAESAGHTTVADVRED